MRLARRESEFELAVRDLLTKARATDDFDQAAGQVERAIHLASRNGMRISRNNLLPGIAGHYGRIDGARIALTCVLVAAITATVFVSLILGDADHASAYTSPLSGLAGIGLGWLFTNQTPSALVAYNGGTDTDAARDLGSKSLRG